MGEEAWSKDAHTGQPFRTSFGQGQPVVVGGVHHRLAMDWSPSELTRLHGDAPVSLLEVGADEQDPFDGYTLRDFFRGFAHADQRPLPPRLRREEEQRQAARAAASSGVVKADPAHTNGATAATDDGANANADADGADGAARLRSLRRIRRPTLRLLRLPRRRAAAAAAPQAPRLAVARAVPRGPAAPL